jgi:filamentous hemagglutinin
MAGSAVGTMIGYPIGSLLEGAAAERINPWYLPDWKDVGLGISAPVSPSALPSWAGIAGGAISQEVTGQPTTSHLNNGK